MGSSYSAGDTSSYDLATRALGHLESAASLPPDPEFELDPEELAYDQEQERLKEEYFRFHGFEVGDKSQ